MIALIEPAAPTAQAPRQSEADQIMELQATVSASRLGLWLQCRLKFYFHYVQRTRRTCSPALHIGSVVHYVLQSWNKARWRKELFTVERSKTLFETHWLREQEQKPIRWDGKEMQQKGTAWSLLDLYFRETPIKPDERPEAVEVPVERDLSNHGLPTLVGIIDLVRSGGRIVDFKTSGQTPNAKRVIHQHEIQTSVYAVLYREATGNLERGIELHHLVKLKKPKVVITTVGPMQPEQQIRLFRILESYVEGLARKDFVPSPGLQCVSCEFFNECRRWS